MDVVAFLRLTFEFEEPRQEEGEGEYRSIQTPRIPYFDHREHDVLIYADLCGRIVPWFTVKGTRRKWKSQNSFLRSFVQNSLLGPQRVELMEKEGNVFSFLKIYITKIFFSLRVTRHL